MKKQGNDKGEVMLEGMIIVILTIFILIWLIGLCFLHYQRYVTTVATNDAAKKVAATYNNPTSDLVMGYIEVENISQRTLYRYGNDTELEAVNEDRAASYIKYILDRTNFVGTVKDVAVDLEYSADNGSASRGHVTVTAKVTFNTPFGEALDFFGMDGVAAYTSTSYAECNDIINYISTADYVDQFTSFSQSGSVAKLINSVFKLCTSHRYEKN